MKASLPMANAVYHNDVFQLHHQISQWDFSVFDQPNAIIGWNSSSNRCSFYFICSCDHAIFLSRQYISVVAFFCFLFRNSSPTFVNVTQSHELKVQVKLVFLETFFCCDKKMCMASLSTGEPFLEWLMAKLWQFRRKKIDATAFWPMIINDDLNRTQAHTRIRKYMRWIMKRAVIA